MRPATKKYVYIFIALLAIASTTLMTPSIQAQRKEHHLVLPPAPEDTAMSMLYTPLLAVGRAPLVDVLWMRATKLKEQGRIFDALQLAKTICKLQPKFAQVWAFMGWNMAYNISVTCSSPEERWRWVRNGYELIRDKGIPLNPNNTQLYKEFAWILFHKVGDFMDEMHQYYKLQFALIAENAMGTPPPDYVRVGRVRGDFYRDYDFAILAAVPETYDGIFKHETLETLFEQYRFAGLQPGEALDLIDVPFNETLKWVKGLNRPGVSLREIGTLRDLLNVDLPEVRAFIDQLRLAASESRGGGGLIELMQENEDVEALVNKISENEFDATKPGVFDALINATRTNVLTMPEVPEELQDRRKNEFLNYLRSKDISAARRKLTQYWDKRVALDLDTAREQVKPYFEEMRTFVAKLEDYGFNATDGDTFLGLVGAVRDNVLELPGVSSAEQVNKLPAFMELWDDPKYADARRELEAIARRKRVHDEFKIEMMRVLRTQNHFGMTFDFRLAETHALYWSNLGSEIGIDKLDPVDIHKLNTDRLEFYALQKMYHRGRLAMSPEANLGEPPLLQPDLRVIPTLVRTFFEISEDYLKDERNPNNANVSEQFRTGFVGFMRDSILASHEYGDDNMGQWLFNILKKEFPDPMYMRGYEAFLAQEVLEDRELGDYRVTLRRLQRLIGKALENYAVNEDETAVLFMARARQVFDGYRERIVNDRLDFDWTFEGIIKDAVDTSAQIFNRRETYLRVCKKLGIEPLPEMRAEEENSNPMSLQ